MAKTAIPRGPNRDSAAQTAQEATIRGIPCGPIQGGCPFVALRAFCAVLAFWALPAQAYPPVDGDIELFIMPHSWHLKSRDGGDEWNENHNGIGLTYYQDNMTTMILNFDNSVGRNSNAIGLSYTDQCGPFTCSFGGILASGYGQNGEDRAVMKLAPIVDIGIGPLTFSHIPLTVWTIKLTLARF